MKNGADNQIALFFPYTTGRVLMPNSRSPRMSVISFVVVDPTRKSAMMDPTNHGSGLEMSPMIEYAATIPKSPLGRAIDILDNHNLFFNLMGPIE